MHEGWYYRRSKAWLLQALGQLALTCSIWPIFQCLQTALVLPAWGKTIDLTFALLLPSLSIEKMSSISVCLFCLFNLPTSQGKHTGEPHCFDNLSSFVCLQRVAVIIG